MATIEGTNEFLEVKEEVKDVLETYGFTITVTSRDATGTTNDWGEIEFTTGTPETFSGVLYDYSPLNLLFQNSAVLNDGETRIIVGDVSINKSDYIETTGVSGNVQRYKVIEKEIFGGADVVVAQSLRVGRA